MTPEPAIDPATIDAAIDDSARDHVIVEGPDALTYLHSQVAQDLRGLAVGDHAWTLVLEPTGKVDSFARVTRRTDDSFDFDVDAGYGEALAARLQRFKIRVDAEIRVEPASNPAPTDDHEAARVAAGWPRLGFEIVPGQTIPAVTGVVPVAVSFTKGCYPGQELVERMDSRGADAPLSLRIVDAGADAAVGAPLVVDGAEVGSITSVSPSGALALALVKRGHDVGRLPGPSRRTVIEISEPTLRQRELASECRMRRGGRAASGGLSDRVGRGDVAADGDHVGMLADPDQLG